MIGPADQELWQTGVQHHTSGQWQSATKIFDEPDNLDRHCQFVLIHLARPGLGSALARLH